MNRIVMAIIAVGAMLAVGIAQQPRKAKTDAGAVGRYQIVAMDHELIGHPDGPVRERVVLRIDTTTGVVEEWISGVIDGRTVDDWVPTGGIPVRSTPRQEPR